MELIELNIKNFRSIKEDVRLRFNHRNPGVYLITGQNKENPALGSNGVGKSTLFEALHWLLYGRTSRNIKGTDIANWDNKKSSTKVLLLVKHGEEMRWIRRMTKPNRLEISNYFKVTPKTYKWTTVSNQELIELVGLTPIEFQNSVVIPQFGNMLLDLGATQKTELFSQILSLQVWDEAKVRAKEKSKKLTWECDAAHAATTAAHRTFANSQSEASDARSSVKYHIGRLRGVLDNIEEFNKTPTSVKALEQEKVELISKHTRCVTISNTLDEKLKDIRSLLREEHEKYNALSFEYKNHKAQHQATHQRLNTLTSLKSGAKCSVCNSVMDASHLTKEKKALTSELNVIQKEMDAVNRKLLSVAAHYKDREDRERTIQDRIQTIRDTMNVLYRATSSLDSKLEYAHTKRNQLTTAEATARADLKNALVFEKNLRAARKRDERNVEEVKAKQAALEASRGYVDFWIKGFESIRLKILYEVLEAFQFKTNQYLTELGLPEFTVTYNIEKEGKTGTISQGFYVEVSTTGSLDKTPFEGFSGGECERVKIAAAMALIDVVTARKATNFNIEVWDEPCKYLSQDGMDAFISSLSNRAKELNKRIFLIDHNNIAHGSFTGYIMVSKTSSDTHLISRKFSFKNT